MNKKVLVIDDDESIIWVIKKALEPSGYSVSSRTKLSSGLRAVQSGPQVILLDLVLPDGDGLDGLREIRSTNPEAVVIMITAHAKMQSTIVAMKEGAYDYLEKPFDIEELIIVVEKAFRDLSLRAELEELRKTTVEAEERQIVGKSPKILKIFKEIGKIAPKDITVLVTGESGTGKELVAKALHQHSKRTRGPFVIINSAAIPKELLESELFGYKKGAFTGAERDKQGKIELANGGTLFLDEISEMDINLQAKVLRFLQDHEFSPLGAKETIKANVRIIGATNRDLSQAISTGAFREDLYYRFNVVQIKIPPLRDRKEDIPLLARHFLREAAVKLETKEKELSQDALAQLIRHEWPGNVRELENVIRRACVLSSGRLITPKELLLEEEYSYSIKEFLTHKLKKYLKNLASAAPFNLHETVMSEVEKGLLSIVLEETKGNQLKASRILGINRNTLRSKITGYKIK